MLDRLNHIKYCLLNEVETQMDHLREVNADELGEVVDMIKDIEEAIYYATITEAMNSEEYKTKKHDKWYFDERYYPMTEWDKHGNATSYIPDHPIRSADGMMKEERDPREGRSHKNRKLYMESKEKHHDKASQLKELEKYMQELTSDIVEMIEGASAEEKQYLEKKISALATKINQVN